jgi:hypothetical protein
MKPFPNLPDPWIKSDRDADPLARLITALDHMLSVEMEKMFRGFTGPDKPLILWDTCRFGVYRVRERLSNYLRFPATDERCAILLKDKTASDYVRDTAALATHISRRSLGSKANTSTLCKTAEALKTIAAALREQEAAGWTSPHRRAA